MQDITAERARDAAATVLADPRYDWERTTNPWEWVRDAYLDAVQWLIALETTHPIAYWAIVTLALLILAGILIHLVSVLRVAFKYSPEDTAAGSAEPVVRDAAWHLERARELSRARRYRDALAHRWTSLVLELHERGVVEFHFAKTPADYLREIGGDERREPARAIVRHLYDHLFGGRRCDEESWVRMNQLAELMLRGRDVAAT